MQSLYSTNFSERGFFSPAHICQACKCHLSTTSSSNPYLTPFTAFSDPKSRTSDPLSLTFNPRHNLFMQTLPAQENGRLSAQKFSVSFSYLSPIMVRNHHSSQGRFSTKKYKQMKFPHLRSKNSQQAPVLQILKKKEPKKRVSQEKTEVIQGKKEAIKDKEEKQSLKMNKVKSNKCLEKSSRNHSNNLSKSSKTSRLSTPKPEEGQPPVPLRQITNNEEQPLNRPQINQKIKNPSLVDSNKYSTIKSIQIYQKAKDPSDTSLKVEELSQGVKKWGLIEASDREIAEALSQELALNYDYFFLLPESDRSISFEVEL